MMLIKVIENDIITEQSKERKKKRRKRKGKNGKAFSARVRPDITLRNDTKV